MALSDLSIEDFELEDKILELNQKLRDVKIKYQNICEEADKLASDELISPKISSNDEDTFDIDVKMEAVKAQAKTFVATTKDLKQKLGASGIKKELTHDELQKLSDSVVKLTEEISEIKKKLQNFRDLPSSLPLAKEKIRAVQLEIQAMEEEFPVLQEGGLL